MSFICHIQIYTEYNQQWNVFLVVDNSSRNRDSNPQPRVTSPTLYPLGHDCSEITDNLTICDTTLLVQSCCLTFH